MKVITTYVKTTAWDDKRAVERMFDTLENAVNYANNDKFGKWDTDYTFYNVTLYADENGRLFEEKVRIENVERQYKECGNALFYVVKCL